MIFSTYLSSCPKRCRHGRWLFESEKLQVCHPPLDENPVYIEYIFTTRTAQEQSSHRSINDIMNQGVIAAG